MPAGSLQYIIECTPVTGGGASVAPCTMAGGVNTQPQVVQAYVIDPGSQGAIDGITQPFDYTYAAGVWAFFFTFTCGLDWVARVANGIIQAVRGA